MKYERNIILEELKVQLNLKDRILLYFFKDYTYRIYINGIRKGFEWYH